MEARKRKTKQKSIRNYNRKKNMIFKFKKKNPN